MLIKHSIGIWIACSGLCLWEHAQLLCPKRQNLNALTTTFILHHCQRTRLFSSIIPTTFSSLYLLLLYVICCAQLGPWPVSNPRPTISISVKQLKSRRPPKCLQFEKHRSSYIVADTKSNAEWTYGAKEGSGWLEVNDELEVLDTKRMAMWVMAYRLCRMSLKPSIGYYVALVLILVITALVAIYHTQIVNELTPVTRWLHE